MNRMKRILSILLVVCMLLTPMPSAAAGNTIAVSDFTSLKSALTSSASGTMVKLTGDISFAETITVPSSLTLDLNGSTLTFTGTDTAKKTLMVGILFTGSGTLTVKDSGTDGKLVTSQIYSAALGNAGSGIMELADGVITTDAETASAIVNAGSGTIKLSGSTVNSDKFIAVFNQLVSGRINMSGGTVSSESSNAIESKGMVEIFGGTVSSNTGIGVNNGGSGSSLTVSGGTVKSISGYAITNSGNGNTVTVTGGTVSSDSGYALSNFNACEVKLSGGTVSSISGMAVVNMNGGNVVISNGAIVNSGSGTTIFTYGSLTITGGTVHSDSGTALISSAPAGSEITVSGGTLSSTSGYCAANCDAGKLTISGNAVLSTVSGGVCLLNQGAGTATINGGTLTADKAELYNLSAGKIEINSGTYALVVNSNASGKIVINGGSVKAIQGTTPTNSAGTALSFYGITLTDGSAPIAKDTVIAAGELILNPAVSYGFNGVKTDASGTIYLWLPATVATANYKSGSIDVSGSITAGKTSVLPNYTARVTVKLNGETWNNPFQVLLLTSKDSALGADTVIPDGNAAKEGGVYVFSGLKPGKDYYIWGSGTIGGLLPSGVKITSSEPNAAVNFYNLNVTAGSGIDGVFLNATLIQGADIRIQANVKPGYTFEKWANTTGGELVLTTPSGNIKMDGKKDLTATATLNTYEGSVTLNRDDSAWISSGKTIILSTSDTDKNATGYQTVSVDTNGVYSFTDLSPLVIYYVWMDDKYTGQTVTPTDKDAAVDYYTVALNSGANIASVSGGGVYLKGTEITASATIQTGDYVFSRWQNSAGGAMVSAVNPYTFTVNSAVSLTAVGGATKYIASVTLKKDGADWSTSPRNIVLSTSGTELAGTVTGTVSGNTYTFANLSGIGTYFVWDADSVTYANVQIDSTLKNAALDYYTLTVTPGSNITAVIGEGTYLKGSSVNVTATPADYYRITGVDWTDGTYTVNNLSAAQTITPAAELDTYNGTVTIKKDGIAWADSGKTVTLSTSSVTDDGLLLTGIDPSRTYYIWVDGVYTEQVLSRASASAVVDYYTVNLSASNVTFSGAGVYLSGSDVTLTATGITAGYEFLGWYSGSTLLSGDTTLTLSDLNGTQTLTAKAANNFTATVVVSGAAKSVTLVNGGTTINPDSGTSGTFSGLDRSVTYRVYANGADTGKTASKLDSVVALCYYTVSLTAGPGISSVSESKIYLAGSDASINASVESGYIFTGWNGTGSYSDLSATISGIDKNYALVASAYKPYAGEPFDISNGSITISDSATAGKIMVVQGGVTTDDIDPTEAFIIMGTSTNTQNYNILIDASRGAVIILNNLDISVKYDSSSALKIEATAGNVTLLLSNVNSLYAVATDAATTFVAGVALLKDNTAGLTIQSIDGTVNHSLSAIGYGSGSSGIGNRNGNSFSNVTINSGNLTIGGWGSGIGVFRSTTSNLKITGGIVNTDFIGGATHTDTVLDGFTVSGGTVIVANGAHIGGGVYSSNVIFTGGSLKVAFSNVSPKDSNAADVYKVTLSTGLKNTELSGRLLLTKSGDAGFSYGTKDMWTTNDANGDVYLYLSNGTYTATLGSMTKIIVVGDADLTDSVINTYSVNTPDPATGEGITASATPAPDSGMTGEETISVNVSFSGTAQKEGAYTVGLTGTGIGTVATQTVAVTKNQSVSASKDFSFTMPASDVTDLALILNFSETAKHTVSYYNDSTLLGSAAYYVGETYTLMDSSSLQKTGYTCTGWGVSGDQTMSTSDVVHTAVWTPNTYKVVFHNDSSTTEQNFTYNADATALNGSFTKTGSTLSGWATTATPNAPKVYNVNATVQNLTAAKDGVVNLYAVWQAQSCSVSFANGGGTGTMAPQSFIHGIAQELTPNAFTRTGYTFIGWTDGATTYVDGQSVTATGSINLTAQWTANSYRVVFSGNGANGGTTMASKSFSYDAAPQSLTTNTYTRDGYAFGGWATSSNGTKAYDNGQSVQNLTAGQNGTVTLYAVWTPNSYTINFNAGTGTGTVNSQTHTYDAAQTLTENAFTKAGYSFSGWNTQADGYGLNYADKASVINLAMTGSVMLYAQWTADTYALAFNSSNGVGSMDNQNFATGDSGTLSDSRFVKPGYTFDGWNTKADGSGTNYASNAALMSLDNLASTNPTLYAKWRANSYTVAFNSNGGTESMGNQTFTYDVSKNLTSNSFARGSDTFLGWSTSSTAETATYTNGQSVSNLSTIADGKVTLYAVWRANTYEVRFDANGGSGDMLPQTIGRSDAAPLNINAYTRIGYSFAGWNTMTNGSGLSYADGHEVTNLPGDTANSITLYAQWTESVRYNLNGSVKESGGALLSGATVKLIQGSAIIAQTKTGTDGSYLFGNLKSGSYNVVGTKDGKTITVLVTITANTIQDIILPAAAANNSVLVVTSEPNAEVPALTVGGLDDLASIESADITMTVTAKAKDDGDGAQLAIQEKSGSQAVGVYLDMTVKKGSDIQTSTAKVLEIVIPFNFSGKTDINVYRHHGGQAGALTKLTDKPAAPFADGTFYLDSANGLIHVYSSQFSTYAVTYTGVSSSSSGGGGGGTSANPVNIDTTDSTFPFVDVSETHWAREAIAWASENGLFSGTSATTFGPGITTTRGMVVTVLWRMENQPSIMQDTTFADVSADAYYGKAVDWANKNGVVLGYGNSLFGPNNTITREQMAAILYRYAQLKGYDTSKSTKLDSFADGSKTTGYARTAMEWAVANNLISGKENNILDPNGNATRAEVAVMLMRFTELNR